MGKKKERLNLLANQEWKSKTMPFQEVIYTKYQEEELRWVKTMFGGLRIISTSI